MKYLILGAGPAGLTFANRLLEMGETSFLVLEAENIAGGLCRSTNVDKSPLDLGGGHFLDVRRPIVNEFLFKFMAEEEWKIFSRDSRIVLDNNEIVSHPLESNIWQMNYDNQIKYLKSIAVAGCNLGEPSPKKFVEWIYWKFGKAIVEDYLLPYNRKIYSHDLDLLGTYWLEKLPNVSFDETLMSCLKKKAYGTQPGHAQFYYPKKYGYGELWLRMATKINNHIAYNVKINSIDFNNRIINKKYAADVIINTIPWTEFSEVEGIPVDLKSSILKLKYTSIEVKYYSENMNTDAHWIYYPNPDLSYHRILVRHNFCLGSKGYWTETNSIRSIDNLCAYSNVNKYAYPLNTLEKPVIMKNLLEWTKSQRVYGLGRWGEWQHYNSDETVELALKLADELLSL